MRGSNKDGPSLCDRRPVAPGGTLRMQDVCLRGSHIQVPTWWVDTLAFEKHWLAPLICCPSVLRAWRESGRRAGRPYCALWSLVRSPRGCGVTWAGRQGPAPEPALGPCQGGHCGPPRGQVLLQGLGPHQRDSCRSRQPPGRGPASLPGKPTAKPGAISAAFVQSDLQTPCHMSLMGSAVKRSPLSGGVAPLPASC